MLEFFRKLISGWRRSQDRQQVGEQVNDRVYLFRQESGKIDGRHYTAYVDDVKKLKREGRLEDAENLLLRLVEAVEAEAKEMEWGVAPWYYEQLAIVYRKQQRYRDEIAILERYDKNMHAPGVGPSKLSERLNKARALLTKKQRSG